MDVTIQEIIDRLHVVVIVGKLDNPGYYIPGINAIYIDESLNECDHEIVLLHELGHAAKHRNDMPLYHATMTMKIKMEYGANRFMIKYLFNKYIANTGDDPASVNYLDFMRQNDIPSRDEGIVREVIENY